VLQQCALGVDPEHYESYFGRGSCYDVREEYRKALGDYNRALALCRDYPELWYAKADLLYNMGRVRESLSCYRMVTRLEPGNFEAWLDYGETLQELGYLRQALKAFDKAVESNPRSADPHYCRAKVLVALRRYFDAAESFRTSFQIDPDKKLEFERDYPGSRSIKELRNLLKA